jgi:hypothetical protein
MSVLEADGGRSGATLTQRQRGFARAAARAQQRRCPGVYHGVRIDRIRGAG